ncbi:hypothetical protein [Cytobacillus praedii]|uniref:hypothetical protein n=1 Tax=Cytobacillus praedii TaxID=1742358 RepID=UPI002E204599|nr:hypothetical protein [Cytobacillus praedii]
MLDKRYFIARQVLLSELTTEEIKEAKRIPIKINGSKKSTASNYTGSVNGISLHPIPTSNDEGLSEIRLQACKILINDYGYTENSAFISLITTDNRNITPWYFKIYHKK